MAATVTTSLVTATEHDPDRCESEEETRGAEAEDSGQQQQTGPVTVSHSRLSKLPLSRIKALMKTDPDVALASQESVFIIAKATVRPLISLPVLVTRVLTLYDANKLKCR